MPQAINVTVKDGAATPADTLFTLMTPAAGKLPAVWFAKTKGPTTASQPKLEVSSEGSGSSRKVKLTLRVPDYVTSTDGSVQIGDSWFASVSVTIPDRVAAGRRADGAAFIGNLLTHALLKEVSQDGYAPA